MRLLFNFSGLIGYTMQQKLHLYDTRQAIKHSGSVAWLGSKKDNFRYGKSLSNAH